MKPGIQSQLAAHSRPGHKGKDPGSANRVCVYQSFATWVNARHTAEAQRIHPTGLRGRREATSAPSPPNATIMTAKLSDPTALTWPVSGGGRRVPSSTKPTTAAMTAMAAVSPKADQASRAAATRPILCAPTGSGKRPAPFPAAP